MLHLSAFLLAVALEVFAFEEYDLRPGAETDAFGRPFDSSPASDSLLFSGDDTQGDWVVLIAPPQSRPINVYRRTYLKLLA